MFFTEISSDRPVCTGGIIVVDPGANPGVRIMGLTEPIPLGKVWTRFSPLDDPLAHWAGRPTAVTEAALFCLIWTRFSLLGAPFAQWAGRPTTVTEAYPLG